MKNSSTVQFEFTGGYEAGDYELIKDGFKIGNVYQGELYPDENKVWVGTSVGSPAGFPRIVEMLKLKYSRKVKTMFISMEPYHEEFSYGALMGLAEFDWIIVGGESGNETGKYQYRPCKLEWLLAIILIGRLNHVPVFVKQLGTQLAKELELKDRHGKDLEEWPETLRVREFPRQSTVVSFQSTVHSP